MVSRQARGAAVAVAIAILTISGCGVGTSSREDGASSGPTTTGSTRPGTSSGPSVTKLLVFVVENHSFASMREQMPWTFRMSERYGYATNYDAITHPSLPNYLAIAGGSDFGYNTNAGPDEHRVEGESVFGQALALGKTAAIYAEDMAVNCQREDTPEGYAVRHNPWVYFVEEQEACKEFDVPLERLADDVASGSLPHAGMVIPNVCNDGHDCPLSVTDAWMREQVTLAMSGPDWAAGNLAIVITADEDDDDADNQVLTSVFHPSLSGVVTDRFLTHYSLTRLYDDVLGAQHLREAEFAPSMSEALGLRVG